MQDIRFDSGGERCAAWHLTGEGDAFLGEHGRPCVVLGHGFAGTRDSGLLPYAERFAAAGLDALVFDYRHFGASSGEPRQLVSIAGQHEDYRAAIACARSLEGVDPERIVLWGTSYAGGHVTAVGAADARLAAIISQVPAMDGLAVLRALAGYAGIGALARLAAAGLRDAASAARGGEPVTIPVVGAPGTLAVMSSEDAEPGYRAIVGPTWRNEVCARIMLGAGVYRPGLRAGELRCPLLVQAAVHDSVAPPSAAEAAAWRAKGRAEVRWYPVGHFDLYRGEPFERSVGDELYFLRRHLAGREQGGAATREGASRDAASQGAV